MKLLIDGPEEASHTIFLAHGAGAGMDSAFMKSMAAGLAEQDIRVIRFEFPYMADRRKTGSRRPPNREPILRESWNEVIESQKGKTLIIGGKSMGGRIASLIADETNVTGLLCLGYPFHPSGKPEKLRTEHLQSIETPTLVLQGERDTLGSKEEVARYKLSNRIRIEWLPDGDHSFKPRKKSGHTFEENMNEAIRHSVEFIQSF